MLFNSVYTFVLKSLQNSSKVSRKAIVRLPALGTVICAILGTTDKLDRTRQCPLGAAGVTTPFLLGNHLHLRCDCSSSCGVDSAWAQGSGSVPPGCRDTSSDVETSIHYITAGSINGCVSPQRPWSLTLLQTVPQAQTRFSSIPTGH